jgi:GLPGLI family protein
MINFLVKTVFYCALFFISVFVHAQGFQGEAVYQTKTMFKGKIEIGGDQDPALQKILEESMKKAFEKKFILTFNTFESIYKEEEKLDAPGQKSFGMAVSFSGGEGAYYRNIKENQYTEAKEFFSKEFLVVDQLVVFDWELTEETKTIGDYVCYKAKVVFPVTDEEKENYEKMKEKQETNPTQFFTSDAPKERVVEAWYAPEIPVNHGPAEFWGLPGLILELHDKDKVYLCSKVVLTSKEKSAIKKPKSGQKVTQKAYDDIVEKKFETMKDANGHIRIDISH